jgi:hypothetical protein
MRHLTFVLLSTAGYNWLWEGLYELFRAWEQEIWVRKKLVVEKYSTLAVAPEGEEGRVMVLHLTTAAWLLQIADC